MKCVKSYLTLFRVSNLPTVWSNVLAAALLCGGPFSPAGFFLLLLSLSLSYCGGMALNDICDAETDRAQRSSRPIPAGEIPRRQALLITLAVFFISLLLLAVSPYPIAALASGAILLLLILFYDLFHKDHPWSVLLMAGCRLMVYIVTGLSLAGSITPALLTISLIQFGYILLVSLTARHENNRSRRFSYPLIPLMLAAICSIDGIFLSSLLKTPLWLIVGGVGTLLTAAAQGFVRGD